MATKASVTLRGRFTEGTEVTLYRRGAETEYNPGQAGSPVAKAKTDKRGETNFDVPEGRYWAVGTETEHRPNPEANALGTVPVEVRRVAAVTAKPVAPRQPAMRRRETTLTSAAPGRNTGADTVTGARGSGNSAPSADSPTVYTDPETGAVSQYASNSTGVPSESVPAEPQPHLRQEDAGDVVQRSATLTGQATPKDPDELQPRPSQEDLREGRIPGIPKNVVQRSATPFGEATPKPRDEVAPQARQEDTEPGLLQRSSTPTGAAEPKPAGSAMENQLAKDNSAVASTGATVAKTGTAKVPSSGRKRSGGKKRSGAKKASSAKKAPATKAAKKATAAAKKGAKKGGGRR